MTLNTRLMIVVAIIYFIFAQIGFLFVVQSQSLAAVWPVSGVVLAILILQPYEKWFSILCGVFVANILANLSSGNPVVTSLGFAIANSSEGLVSAWVVGRFVEIPVRTLSSFSTLLAFIVAAVVGNATTALIGAWVVTFSFGAPFWETWRIWWVADGVGMLVVAPLIVVFYTNRIDWKHPYRLRFSFEFILLCMMLILIAQVIFGISTNETSFLLASAYLIFPFLLWTAYRFGVHVATVTSLLVAIIVVWDTKDGLGPFIVFGRSPTEQIIGVQVFLVVATLTALSVAIALAERNQAEKIQAEERNLLRTLIDSIPDYIYVKDLDGRFLLNNQSHVQALGATNSATVLGKTDYNFSTQSLADSYAKDDQQVISSQEAIVQREEMSKGLNQEPIWASTTKVPLYDEHRNIYGIVGVTRDVTKQKALLEEISQQELKYRTLIQHLPNASVLLFDKNLRYLLAEGEHLIDNGFTGIEGKTIGEILPETSLRDLEPLYQQALAGNSKSIQRTFNDTIYNVQIVPVRDEEGNIFAGMALAQDITALKEAEAHMLELVAERERVKLFVDFIGDASHDLKTPLTIIKTSLHLMKHVQDEEKHKKHLTRIDAQTERLHMLLDKLFTMSRIDSYQRYEFQLSDMNMMLEQLYQQLSMLTETKNIHLQYQLDQALPPIEMDVSEIERIFLNLVENAVRFTSENGTITIKTYLREDILAIDVTDTGVGIESSAIDDIFKRFFKADDARSSSVGGVGLGLSIVKKIMDAHRGQIEVQSEPNQGTTFTLLFPTVAKVI